MGHSVFPDAKAHQNDESKDDDNDNHGDSGNSGTMIVDAPVLPLISAIRRMYLY